MAYAAYAKSCPACGTLTTFSADLGDEMFIAQCPCCKATYQEPSAYAAPKPTPVPETVAPDLDKDDPARHTDAASHLALDTSRLQVGDQATNTVPEGA